jgi:putative glycerol-1-phosphate prenyltransferase
VKCVISIVLSKFLHQVVQQKSASVALLVDPSSQVEEGMSCLAKGVEQGWVDAVFYGGSLRTHTEEEAHWNSLRKRIQGPIFAFPSNALQVHPASDGLLHLSLVSGRNPDYLIGRHVEAAVYLNELGIDIIPTAYLLIDGGKVSTTSYITNTSPIPSDKVDIAYATALAGVQLGMKAIYLEAGSGADNVVPITMVKTLSSKLDVPIIVGGGIRSAEQMHALSQAGADVLVIGNAFEENPFQVMADLRTYKCAVEV